MILEILIQLIIASNFIFIFRIIIDWSKTTNISSEKFSSQFCSSSMTDITFDDLNFRINKPYLFCHQGDCQHLFTITDVRFTYFIHFFRFEHEDDVIKEEFPKITFQSLISTSKCDICLLRLAKYI